mmetsp:Transcript_24511/g.39444  ORF Transcript_24511/g.39444 Transcript_24511/m.39444 type:complete len:205 (-) Transcript_24511:224-838(-)
MCARHEHWRQHEPAWPRKYISERRQHRPVDSAPLALVHSGHLNGHQVHEAVGGAGAGIPPPVCGHQCSSCIGDLSHCPEHAVHVPGVLGGDESVRGAAPHKRFETLRRGVVQPNNHLVTIDLLASAGAAAQRGGAARGGAGASTSRRRRGLADEHAPGACDHGAVRITGTHVVARERREDCRHGKVPACLARGSVAQHEAVLVH